MTIILEESWFWSQVGIGANCSILILLAMNPTSYLNFQSFNFLTYQKANFTAGGYCKD